MLKLINKPVWLFILVAILLSGCVRLAHVEPQPRYYYDAQDTVVKIYSWCGGKASEGSGVIISERHVLTAAHVTACHDIPVVYVSLTNGDIHRTYVTREDEARDISRLELAHAGRFGLNIAPPTLHPSEGFNPEVTDYVTIYRFNYLPETVERVTPTLLAARANKGDSGTPVYDTGNLVGLVISDIDGKYTRITLIAHSWLSGT